MQKDIEIDNSLTPDNASSKNMIWIQDIIFDSEAPEEAKIDIRKYIEEGYVLGKCASSTSTNNFVGLYKKISLS